MQMNILTPITRLCSFINNEFFINKVLTRLLVLINAYRLLCSKRRYTIATMTLDDTSLTVLRCK